MVEHGPGLGRNLEAERADAARRLAVFRAAQVGVEAIINEPRLNHTFCLHSGALLKDGCDNPGARVLAAMRYQLEPDAQESWDEAIQLLISRAIDEGVAVTTHRYEGHDFVIMSDASQSRPSTLMRNSADPLTTIQAARLEARRNLANMSVEDILRGDRFISRPGELQLATPAEDTADDAAAFDAAIASYVRAGLAKLPAQTHLQPVFKTYSGEVLAPTGHNIPGQHIADWLAAEPGHPSLFFKQQAFTALLDAYAETGRPITRQRVEGSHFVTVGAEDSIFPRSFIRNNPVLAA